jgi:hypothetical protein
MKAYRDGDVLNRLTAALRSDGDFLDTTGSFGIGRRHRIAQFFHILDACRDPLIAQAARAQTLIFR